MIRSRENLILVHLREDYAGHEDSPYYKSFWQDAANMDFEGAGYPDSMIADAKRVLKRLAHFMALDWFPWTDAEGFHYSEPDGGVALADPDSDNPNAGHWVEIGGPSFTYHPRPAKVYL